MNNQSNLPVLTINQIPLKQKSDQIKKHPVQELVESVS